MVLKCQGCEAFGVSTNRFWTFLFAHGVTFYSDVITSKLVKLETFVFVLRSLILNMIFFYRCFAMPTFRCTALALRYELLNVAVPKYMSPTTSQTFRLVGCFLTYTPQFRRYATPRTHPLKGAVLPKVRN